MDKGSRAKLLFTTLTVLIVVDLATCYYALTHLGYVEFGPVMNFLLSYGWPAVIGYKAVTLALLYGLRIKYPKRTTEFELLTVALIVLYIVVLINNICQIGWGSIDGIAAASSQCW